MVVGSCVLSSLVFLTSPPCAGAVFLSGASDSLAVAPSLLSFKTCEDIQAIAGKPLEDNVTIEGLEGVSGDDILPEIGKLFEDLCSSSSTKLAAFQPFANVEQAASPQHKLEGVSEILVHAQGALATGYLIPLPIPNGWRSATKRIVQNYNLDLHTHAAQRRCMLSFQGTHSVRDAGVIASFAVQKLCGAKFHSGFVKGVHDLLKMPAFRSAWLPLLSGPTCSGGVTVTGHSMGGAFAEILNHCLNRGNLSELVGVGVKEHAFKIKALYTFSAPRVTQAPGVVNPLEKSGCYPGVRVSHSGDIVPVMTLGTVPVPIHPKMRAISLSKKCNNFKKGTCEPVAWGGYACDAREVVTFPRTSGSIDPFMNAHRVTTTIKDLDEVVRLER